MCSHRRCVLVDNDMMRSGMDVKSSQVRLPWIDWLRFSAAAVVLLAHARGYVFESYGNLAGESRSPLVFLVTRVEHEAVIVFFVLSGFLVGGKGLERLLRGDFRRKDYVIDRCSRILVPLFPALVLTVICAFVMGEVISSTQLLGNVLGLQGIWVAQFGKNAPLWSLAYEYWFYVLLWAVALFTAKEENARFLAGGVLLLVLLVFTSLKPVFLFSWVIGAVMWFLPVRKWKLLFLFLGGIVMVYSITGIQVLQAYEGEKAGWTVALERWYPEGDALVLLLSASVALVVGCLVQLPVRMQAFLRVERVGAWLAGFSYTLYLTHFPLLRLLPHFGLERADVVDGKSVLVYLSVCTGCILVALFAV